MGERRWRPPSRRGSPGPGVVRDASDAEALELALVENLLREDLNPLEEADAYQRLLAEFGWTQEELAQRIGKDRSSIANALRLRRLPEPIQEDLRTGRLTMGHARALLGLTRRRPSSACASDPRPGLVRARDRGRRRRPDRSAARARAGAPRRSRRSRKSCARPWAPASGSSARWSGAGSSCPTARGGSSGSMKRLTSAYRAAHERRRKPTS